MVCLLYGTHADIGMRSPVFKDWMGELGMNGEQYKLTCHQ